MTVDEEAMIEAARLDGCYAIRTDLPKDKVSREVVHDRYKDLAQVEWPSANPSRPGLGVRPVHVRNETRTCGHALVVTLAYLIVQST